MMNARGCICLPAIVVEMTCFCDGQTFTQVAHWIHSALFIGSFLPGSIPIGQDLEQVPHSLQEDREIRVGLKDEKIANKAPAGQRYLQKNRSIKSETMRTMTRMNNPMMFSPGISISDQI